MSSNIPSSLLPSSGRRVYPQHPRTCWNRRHFAFLKKNCRWHALLLHSLRHMRHLPKASLGYGLERCPLLPVICLRSPIKLLHNGHDDWSFQGKKLTLDTKLIGALVFCMHQQYKESFFYPLPWRQHRIIKESEWPKIFHSMSYSCHVSSPCTWDSWNIQHETSKQILDIHTQMKIF